MLAIASRDWEFPLFLHVLGAMLLVGLLLAVAFALVFAWRPRDGGEQVALTRFAFWTLLVGVIPSFLLMRITAQWVESEAPFDEDASWISIGYITSEPVAVPGIVLSTVFAGVAMRRMTRDGSASVLGRVAAILTLIVIAALLVAIWAMTAKPE